MGFRAIYEHRANYNDSPRGTVCFKIKNRHNLKSTNDKKAD